jgi:CRP/FNR family nitrogen fixation transcriptional regulator
MMNEGNHPGRSRGTAWTAPTVLQSVATITQWRREQEICSQEGCAGHWYRVLEGAVRKCIVRPNGQRQIVDLLLPGDFFGFTTHDQHRFAVQAVIEGTVIACYPRRRAEALADADPQIAREIRERAFETISRLQEQLLVVGRMSALEKVGSFLVKMAERLPGRRNDGITLPISRYDIADHLGISVETVSRSITELQHCGLISLGGPRRVRIVDKDSLEDGSKDF